MNWERKRMNIRNGSEEKTSWVGAVESKVILATLPPPR